MSVGMKVHKHDHWENMANMHGPCRRINTCIEASGAPRDVGLEFFGPDKRGTGQARECSQRKFANLVTSATRPRDVNSSNTSVFER